MTEGPESGQPTNTGPRHTLRKMTRYSSTESPSIPLPVVDRHLIIFQAAASEDFVAQLFFTIA